MRYGLKQTAAPAVEPVDLATAKLHCIALVTADALIERAIAAARQFAENKTRRAFITQSWTLYLDEFPRPGLGVGAVSWWYGTNWGTTAGPVVSALPEGSR